MLFKSSPTPMKKRKITVNTLNSIRSNIAAYAGGASIARELLQNADDAKATWIEFHFEQEALVVKNSSVFSERDFDAICDIGSGNKHLEQDKIGTWGTGFLSVYQITDNPEILSAGKHLILDPHGQEFWEQPGKVVNHTELRFPWRREHTEIGQRIEADVWSPSRIQRFQEEIMPEMYRALIFLRNLLEIKIYRQGQQICEIKREFDQRQNLPGGTVFERWKFTTKYRLADGQESKPKKDPWLFYRNRLSHNFINNAGQTVKSAEYSLAIGFTQTPFNTPLQGTLYNYLPTEIDTGFNFQINGDFFPDANRKSILKGDGSHKSRWNEDIIEALANLFASSLEHLRELYKQSEATRQFFYKLLPINFNPKHSFLLPFTYTLREKIRDLAIVFTTDEQWTPSAKIRWVNLAKMRPLVEGYLPGIAPKEFPAGLAEFLSQFAGSRELQISDFLVYLAQVVKDNTLLRDAPGIVNSTSTGFFGTKGETDRKRLYEIYRFLAHHFEEYEDEIKTHLVGVPLCLNQHERLRAFGRTPLFLATEKLRQLFPEKEDWLVDVELENEKKAARILTAMLPQAGLPEVLGRLKVIASNNDNVPIIQASVMLNSREKLARLCSYLVEQNVFLNYRADLANLPLAIDETHRLRRLNAPLFLAEPEIRDLLREHNVSFVSSELEQYNPDWARLLEQGGIYRLTVFSLINFLGRFFQQPQPLGTLYRLEWLLRLYNFFYSRSKELIASPEQIRLLRQLPFVLTQNGNLAAIEHPTTPLSLPPASSNAEIKGVAEILQLDYLINEAVLEDELRLFFKNTLKVKEVDRLEYIGRYISQHYAKNGLSHEQRFKLFSFILDNQYLLKSSSEGERILRTLRDVPLIRCSDDIYRNPSEVYFDSDFLDRVFPQGYPQPHPVYKLAKANRTTTNSVRQNGAWANLFETLGVEAEPQAHDLINSVRRTVQLYRPADNQALEHIRYIFTLLARDWQLYPPEALEPLKTLSWLPAEDDNLHWYRPPELYPASLRELVKSQAKILPFGQASAEFSQFFGLNIEARLDDVVNHLLALSQHNQPVGESYRIYTYLNDYKDRPEIERLRNKAVIYDRERRRYWLPEHTFTEDYNKEFGAYRFYPANQLGNSQGFFRKIGVRTRIEPVSDYTSLLEEIGSKQNDVMRVSDEDRRLLNNAYVKLTEALALEKTSNIPAWLGRLQKSPIVLTTAHELVTADKAVFNDRTDLLEKFPPGKIRVVELATEKGQPFLEALGVAYLGKTVKRVKHSVEGEKQDSIAGAKLRELRFALHCIKKHYEKEKVGDWWAWRDLAWLKQIEVYNVSSLKVQYILEAGNQSLEGNIFDESAFLETDTGKLFIFQIAQEDARSADALARELVRLLHPTLTQSVLLPIVRELLQLDFPKREQVLQILDKNVISRVDYTGEDFSSSEENSDSPESATLPEDSLLTPLNQAENYQLDLTGLPERITPRKIELPVKTPKEVVIQPTLVADTELANLTGLTAGETGPQAESGFDASATTKIAKLSTSQSDFGSTGTASLSPKPLENLLTRSSVADSNLVAGDKAKMPIFTGQTRPRVPYIATNYQELKKRYGHLASSPNLQEFSQIEETIRRDLKGIYNSWDDEDATTTNSAEYVTKVRFTLTFQMCYEGFLPINNKVKTMLPLNVESIECRVDGGASFPLYIDRKNKILHNREALPAFFSSELIPAGGIVYLELIHQRTFSLFYNPAPHVVKNVRLATVDENGQVVYEYAPEMEVNCETEEYVFRADKRLEDQQALFLEAIGKKSVFETIIDIFESNKSVQTRLHEDSIFIQVFNIRMITAFTVRTELRRRPCFVDEGKGYWSFNPGAIFGVPLAPAKTERLSVPGRSNLALPEVKAELANEISSTPALLEFSEREVKTEISSANSAEENLQAILTYLSKLEAQPETMAAFLNGFRQVFDNFVLAVERVYYTRLNTSATTQAQFSFQTLLSELKANPADTGTADNFRQLLAELLEQSCTDARQYETVKIALQKADSSSLQRYVYPQISQLVEKLVATENYQTAIKILELAGETYSRRIEELTYKQQTREKLKQINGTLSLEQELALLLEILDQDSGYKEARRTLDARVLAYADRPLKKIETACQKRDLVAAVGGFSKLKDINDTYKKHMNNPDGFKSFFDKAQKTVTDLVNTHRGNTETEIHSLARLHYYELVKSANTAKIIDLLLGLGQLYSNKNEPVQASLAISQALGLMGDSTYSTEKLLGARRQLRTIYNDLQLWDLSHKLCELIEKTCPEEEVMLEKSQTTEISQKRRAETSVFASHHTFLGNLQHYKNNNEFYACYKLFLEEIIRKESKGLSYVG